MIIITLGILAGNRNTSGTFLSSGSNAYFWSSVQSGTSAWYRYLDSGTATVFRNAVDKAFGFSVRCLKDWCDYLRFYLVNHKFDLICGLLNHKFDLKQGIMIS